MGLQQREKTLTSNWLEECVAGCDWIKGELSLVMHEESENLLVTQKTPFSFERCTEQTVAFCIVQLNQTSCSDVIQQQIQFHHSTVDYCVNQRTYLSKSVYYKDNICCYISII